jgi:hypothetical protein
MGTARSAEKRVDVAQSASEQRALSVAQIVAGVFVLIFVLGLVKSVW